MPTTTTCGKLSVAALACLCCLVTTAAPQQQVVGLRLSFEGDGDQVFSQDGRVVGTFVETASRDAQVVYDKAYHVPGKVGDALHFVREGHSHVRLQQRAFSAPVSKLAISVYVRSALEHTGALVCHDIDSSKDGFSLFVRQPGIRFRYGDGKTSYVTQSQPVPWADGEWHQIEAAFDAGTIELFFDGKSCHKEALAGTTIAPPSQPLHLGTYPFSGGKGRSMYSFEGDMDEVVLAADRAAVAALLASPPYEPPDTRGIAGLIQATCKPVDSTRRHFGGALFHTFRGQPVPLSFMLKAGRAKGEVKQSSLVFYLPTDVQLVDVFAGYRNGPYQVVKTERSTATRDGRETQRIETTWDTYPPHVVIGLDSPPGTADKTTLEWAMKVNGVEFPPERIELRFLEARPVPAQPGRFMVGLYMMGEDMTYSTPDLRRKVADLYLASGIRRKGLNYQTTDPRGEFDRYLRSRGFLMHNMSMWHGPLAESAEKSGFPPALSVTGKALPKICPSVLWRDDFRTYYRKAVAKSLQGTKDGDWVFFDYEPWNAPSKECFCPACLARFRKAYKIPDGVDPRAILGKHRKEWTEHWLDIYEQVLVVWTDAVKAYNPTLKTAEYTYTYDYKRGYGAFWGCPKDPRRADAHLDAHMLRLYYRHGRAAFDGVDTMIREHKLPVCAITMVTDNPQPQESLTPDQLYEKAILCASLGVQDFYLWPDKWIDGAYHQALGRACQDIWRVEDFYFQGQRQNGLVEIRKAKGKLAKQDYAHTVWEKDGKYLLTVINCTGREQIWEAAWNAKGKPAPQHGTDVLTGKAMPANNGRLALQIPPHAAAFVVLE